MSLIKAVLVGAAGVASAAHDGRCVGGEKSMQFPEEQLKINHASGLQRDANEESYVKRLSTVLSSLHMSLLYEESVCVCGGGGIQHHMGAQYLTLS